MASGQTRWRGVHKGAGLRPRWGNTDGFSLPTTRDISDRSPHHEPVGEIVYETPCQPTQAVAATTAGFSERTARRLEAEPEARSRRNAEPRTSRTRSDPLADVWAGDIGSMLAATPSLRPVTILNELARHFDA